MAPPAPEALMPKLCMVSARVLPTSTVLAPVASAASLAAVSTFTESAAEKPALWMRMKAWLRSSRLAPVESAMARVAADMLAISVLVMPVFA